MPADRPRTKRPTTKTAAPPAAKTAAKPAKAAKAANTAKALAKETITEAATKPPVSKRAAERAAAEHAATEHANNVAALSRLGLREGDRVRFQRAEGGRWIDSTVVRVERDGSIGVRDANGAARSIAAERLELRVPTKRGAATWRPLVEHVKRPEQLDLWR